LQRRLCHARRVGVVPRRFVPFAPRRLGARGQSVAARARTADPQGDRDARSAVRCCGCGAGRRATGDAGGPAPPGHRARARRGGGLRPRVLGAVELSDRARRAPARALRGELRRPALEPHRSRRSVRSRCPESHPMTKLAALDLVAIALYFGASLGIGYWALRRNRGASADYFLAGRDVGWLAIGASLFSTNIGSEHLVGLAGTGAASGLAVGQFEWLACLILLLLGWLFAPFYLRSRLEARVPSDFVHIWKAASHPDFPWTGIVFGAPILGIWYWCTDQYMVQRVLAAKSGSDARLGTIWAGFLKLLPVFIFVLPGVVARALYPEIRGSAADQAYPVLVTRLLPLGLKGVVMAAMLAALMSSLA